MIIDKTIKVKVSKKNIEHFQKRGIMADLKDIIEINPLDLNEGSHILINVKCDVCHKEKKIIFQKYIKNIKNGGIYCCSSKCAQSKVKNTSLKKFGSEYYMQTEEYKKRYKKTSLEKYGTEHHTQNKEIKNKIKKTSIKIYGVDNPAKSQIVKDKIKNTFLEKYGVDNISKLDYIKKDISNKVNEKMETIKKSRIKSLKEKYNVQNISQLERTKEKVKQTNMNKIGVSTALLLDENRKKSIIQKSLNWKKDKLLDTDLIDIDLKNKIIIGKCEKNHIYKINYKTYYNRKHSHTTICNICNPIIKQTSGKEIQLLQFIEKNYKNKIQTNHKDIISPYELDIYLPDLKLALEFNGLYWHNELAKDKNYHKMKTDLCEEKGIQLIQIWEDDWEYKQDIVKSMILNKLEKIKIKISSKTTEIKEISDNNLIKDFLEENHLRGYIGSKIKIGLFYENELISLMIFGKLKNIKSKDNIYELLRFCNKLNTVVIGSESKLFNYFIKTYNPIQIISYADKNQFDNNLYKQLNFTLEQTIKPNYCYVIDGIRNCRFNFRKNTLIKQGFDKNKTEHEIMLERKIYRIYDSGNFKFIYSNI
jgi:very-short-patch-repair endonuclease